MSVTSGFGLTKDLENQIDAFTAKCQQRQIVGSFSVAYETLRLIRNVISGSRWNHLDEVTQIVVNLSHRLENIQPIELAITGTIKRVLHLIKEETRELQADSLDALDAEEEDDHGDDDSLEGGIPTSRAGLKSLLRQGISEMLDELETASGHIASQALEHIHSNEIFMTLGGSKVVEQFFKKAAGVRKFQIIIAETAPSFNGHDMAASLSSAGIDVTVIPDSAIFAIMSRVNKVIIGAHAVTANGGLICAGGSHILVSAAKHHATPVVVCAGLHKLSPVYPYDSDSLTHCLSPEGVLNFAEGDLVGNVDVYNPCYDYIAPDYLSLYITNIGPHPPSYIQRLVLESFE